MIFPEFSYENYISINREAYNILAEEYDYRSRYPSPSEDSPSVLGKSILSFWGAKILRGHSMLEIGPGSGQILRYFADNGFRTVGVELAEEMSKIAQRNSPKSEIINNNILDIKLEEKFGIVYLGAIIHLFPSKDAVILIEKIHDFLTDDGLLFINTTISQHSSEGYVIKNDYKEKCQRFRKLWTETEFKDFLINHNFNIEREMYHFESDRNKTWIAFICTKKSNRKL